MVPASTSADTLTFQVDADVILVGMSAGEVTANLTASVNSSGEVVFGNETLAPASAGEGEETEEEGALFIHGVEEEDDDDDDDDDAIPFGQQP